MRAAPSAPPILPMAAACAVREGGRERTRNVFAGRGRGGGGGGGGAGAEAAGAAGAGRGGQVEKEVTASRLDAVRAVTALLLRRADALRALPR